MLILSEFCRKRRSIQVLFHRCQPSRIWRLCPLSRPESAIYLKCPGFSRLLLLIMSCDNRVQTSSTTLELWLESLNHVSFMHSAVYLVATTMLRPTVLQFVGGALQQNHIYTEHAHEAIPCVSPPKRQFFLSLKLFFGGWHLCSSHVTTMTLSPGATEGCSQVGYP